MELVADCPGSSKRYRCGLILNGVVQIIFCCQQRTLRTLSHFHLSAGYKSVHEFGLRLVTDENGRRGLYWKRHLKPICQGRDACSGRKYDHISIDDTHCRFNARHRSAPDYKAQNTRMGVNLRPICLGTCDQRMSNCHCVQRPFISRIHRRLRRILEIWFKAENLRSIYQICRSLMT